MNFLLGGRMGDLIHMLWVCKNAPHGPHDLYITDRRDLHSDGFMLSVDETINELWPILKQQDYIGEIRNFANTTRVLTVCNEDKYDLINNRPADNEIVNLNMWRRFAYSTHWVQLLSNTFGLPVNGEAWINVPKEDVPKMTIIHCSDKEARRGNWSTVEFGIAIFIGTNSEYEFFGKDMNYCQPKDLYSMFQFINNAYLFIGNQSLPLAIAHALGVNRIAVLNPIDAAAYVGEETVYSNFKYVL